MTRTARDPMTHFRDDRWTASSVYRMILTHGFEVGHAVGLRESLIAAGRPLLGNPSKRVRRALDTIADADRLLRMCGAVGSSHTWDELLAVE